MEILLEAGLTAEQIALLQNGGQNKPAQKIG
jgi:hypothetical protein